MELYETIPGEKSLALLVVDSEGAIKFAEGEGLFTLGLHPDDVGGRSVFDVVRQLPSVMESIKRALAGERNAARSTHGGTSFEVRSEPRYDGARKTVVGAVMVAVERTVPREPAKTEDGAERVLEQLPVSAWATNFALRITYATGRFLDQAERESRPVLGATIYDLADTEDPSEPAIAAHLAALRGSASDFQYWVAGQVYDVHIEPLRNDTGEVIGCTGVALDATPQRRMEKTLERTEARLRDTQRIAHVGSWEWDVQRNVIDWSEEMYRQWGVAKGDFLRTFEALLDHVHPDDLTRTRNTLRGALRDHKPFALEHRIIRPDGETRALYTSGEVVADARGRALRVVGSSFDVTERSRAEVER
ncbi:MAG: PAS domain-containing protein, partial [Polyangiaceae bacterium]